jgi:hypothetical protein
MMTALGPIDETVGADCDCLATFPYSAHAQDKPASAQGDVSVTIYGNNLALIEDVRRLDPGKGSRTRLSRCLCADSARDGDARGARRILEQISIMTC